jgi:hypothetical protein
MAVVRDSIDSEEKSAPLLTASRLAHDLSNALEIIIQTSFLLGTIELGDQGKAWHKMLDEGVQKATAINRQLRDVLRAESRRDASA